jgi:4-cresol dehydrogenase (hydroxylating)
MNIKKATKGWEKTIGKDYVLSDRSTIQHYEKNTMGLKRHIPTILMPASREEVKRIVEIANEYKTPLYPISKGKNWGLGSRVPVKDGTTVVDMSRMNHIHDVNTKHAYAVVEPGVTQGQLYDYLKENKIPLIMDVTGSGLDSSIIGNALERGVGYFTDRGEELSGLEVVLGDGEIIHTGFGHYPNAKATYLFKHGIGPSLDGLFIQSNCGIVTKAGVGLLHENDSYATFVCKIKKEEQLPEFIDNFAKLKKMGITKSVVHIGNKERTRISISPLIYESLKERTPSMDSNYLRTLSEKLFDEEFTGPWSATGRIFGTKTQVREAKRQIRKKMNRPVSTIYLTDDFIRKAEKVGKLFEFIPYIKKKNVILSSIKPIYNFTKGIPTNDAVKSVYWPIMNPPPELDPDNSPCGVIYYLPITPLDGEEAHKVVSTTNKVLKGYEFYPAITLNTVNENALETVISVPFDKRKPEDVKRAHKAVRELHRELASQGIYPYRASIDMMDEVVDYQNPFWQAVKKIKNALDSNHIISPGRYNLI